MTFRTNPTATQKLIWTLEAARAVVDACAPFPAVSRRADVAAMLHDFAAGEAFGDMHDQTLVALSQSCREQILARLPAYVEILDLGFEESCPLIEIELDVCRKMIVAIGRFKRMRQAAEDHLRAERHLCACGKARATE